MCRLICSIQFTSKYSFVLSLSGAASGATWGGATPPKPNPRLSKTAAPISRGTSESSRTQKINAKLICDANAKSDCWYNRESEMLQVRFSQSAAFANSAAASDPGLCRGMGVMSFFDNRLS
jgi:hypothetical protein